MSTLSCTACRTTFTDRDEMREHYKTEWHRYNLKRKVANLAPVTKEAFDLRMTSIAEQEAQKNKKNVVVVQEEPKEATPQPDSETKEEGEEGEEEGVEVEEVHFTPRMCLFCKYEAASFAGNMQHMTKAHSFFIPDIEFLVDLPGLIKYLGEKIGLGHLCLWCNEKGRCRTVRGVQAHMVDKSHCKICDEDFEGGEFEDFYDYSKSYPDWKERLEKQQKEREERLARGETVEDDTEWQDEEGDEDEWVDEDEEGEGEGGEGEGEKKRRWRRNKEEEEDMPLAVANMGPVTLLSTGEIQLHSGKTLGTRELAYIYKQHHRPTYTRQARLLADLAEQYAIMGYGGSRAEAKKSEMDIGTKNKLSLASMKLGIQANKLQKHFRIASNV